MYIPYLTYIPFRLKVWPSLPFFLWCFVVCGRQSTGAAKNNLYFFAWYGMVYGTHTENARDFELRTSNEQETRILKLKPPHNNQQQQQNQKTTHTHPGVTN
jgi:hypothetical protein